MKDLVLLSYKKIVDGYNVSSHEIILPWAGIAAIVVFIVIIVVL